MRISHTGEIEGSRILYTIGRVQGASGWHASGAQPEAGGDWRILALKRLMAESVDCEADAVIGVEYEVDGAKVVDLADVPVERVTAHGIAVKLAKAA